jgi:soluble lytic murein transglycosylase-like protein
VEYIYRATIREAEKRYEIPQNLLLNLLRAESKNFTRNVIFGIGFHPEGIIGIAGLMPEIAKQYHLTNRRDPIASIFCGAQYLRDLRRKFGSWPRAVMAYNWGETKTITHSLTGEQGTRLETREFVSRVMSGVNHVQ